MMEINWKRREGFEALGKVLTRRPTLTMINRIHAIFGPYYLATLDGKAVGIAHVNCRAYSYRLIRDGKIGGGDKAATLAEAKAAVERAAIPAGR